MVNPIKSVPLALPTDLTNIDLPATMARETAQIQPSPQSHRPGTTSSDQHPAEHLQSGDTPLEKTLQQLNDAMKAWATGMRFDIDEDAQRVVVSIIDSTTGEVLRTVPSEAVIRIAKMIVQLQGGAIDTRA